MQYYIQINEQGFGPLEEEYVTHLLELKKIDDSTIISTDGQNWQRLDSFSAFAVLEPLEVLPQVTSLSQTVEKLWYYSLDGNGTAGPLPFEELEQMVRSGFVRPESIVWREGDNESRLIREEPAFAEFFPSENVGENTSRGFFKRLMSFRSRN